MVGLGGMIPWGVSQEQGGLGTVGLTGGSVEQFRMSLLVEAACGSRSVAQPVGIGTPCSLRLQPGVPLAPCSSPEPALGSCDPFPQSQTASQTSFGLFSENSVSSPRTGG